jgi:predicted protein tyrosine phosphatase
MSNPRITIASLNEARRLLSLPDAENFTSIISISDGGELNEPLAVRRAVYAEKLIMFFDDLCQYTHGYHAPVAEDIAKIIGFAKVIQGTPGECLIHCMAGVSRSAAAAIIVRATWYLQERDTQSDPAVLEAAVAEILSEFPNSYPNLLMVRLADEALKLDGDLVKITKRFMPAPWHP